jgi:hypothetical protein
LVEFCKNNPTSEFCNKHTKSRALDFGPSATVPSDGQVLAVRVKGTALASTEAGALAPMTQIHFSVLRPQADGSLLVVTTSAGFDLPVGGDPNQVTSYAPENLCAKAGDVLTLATNGGFEPTFYPNGVSYQVFGMVAGSRIYSYSKHAGVMNGAQFTPAPTDGVELLLQWDLGTGSNASPLCGGNG